MREIAEWLAKAVSVVEDCGEPEAELLLQQGITSLEDLSECAVDILTSLPGIDEAGAIAIKTRAAELVSVKVETEAEQARLDAEEQVRLRAEAEAAAASNAAAALEAAAAEGTPTAPPDGPVSESVD